MSCLQCRSSQESHTSRVCMFRQPVVGVFLRVSKGLLLRTFHFFERSVCFELQAVDVHLARLFASIGIQL